MKFSLLLLLQLQLISITFGADEECTNKPSLFTTCAKGTGVCDNGICKTRTTQCATFNGKVLSVSTDLAIDGPFTACDASTGKKEESMDCTLSCAGNNLSNSSFVCLDLSKYTNVINVMPDGASCAKEGVAGVCISGACQPSYCRKFRCTNHGNCEMAPGSKSISCTCDGGYFGADCSKSSSCDNGQGYVDSCGVCNGDNTSCPTVEEQSFFKSKTFTTIILPVILVVFVGLLIGSIVYMKKRNKKAPPSFSVVQSNTQDNPSFKKQAQMGISVKFDEFRCIHPYDPVMPDELELRVGDILFKLFEYDDGWAKGYNTRSGAEGVYAVGFTERVISN